MQLKALIIDKFAWRKMILEAILRESQISTHTRVRSTLSLDWLRLATKTRGETVKLKEVPEITGMEVIYLGCFQTPQMVVDIPAIEDADSIGLSFHTESYFGWIDETMNLLKEKKIDDRVSVFVGGTIPPGDTDMLKEIGVSGVFMPGTALNQITDQIKITVSEFRERQEQA